MQRAGGGRAALRYSYILLTPARRFSQSTLGSQTDRTCVSEATRHNSPRRHYKIPGDPNSGKMVIRLNIENSGRSDKVLRRTAAAMAAAAKAGKADSSRNTRAEFKRLKTILPSIRKKENVSKLDIILEAIKYIDDLTEQLEHRLDDEEEVEEEKRPRQSENSGKPEAAVLALAAEAQRTTTTASGFYSDESPGNSQFLLSLINILLARLTSVVLVVICQIRIIT